MHIIVHYILLTIVMYFVHACTYYSLEFGTVPSTEPGAAPIYTNDVLAMVSPEKESVPLLKVCVLRSICL